MNVESKEFWEMVKYEFSQSKKVQPYLCFRSPLFETAWNNWFHGCKQSILNLGKEFIIEQHDYKLIFTVGETYLFCLTTDYNDWQNIKMAVRLDFINWCIQKYL